MAKIRARAIDRVSFLILFTFSVACVRSASLWNADLVYEAAGIIQLPYSEIVEPFHAWYDGKNKRSRQNYYNGLNNIYQRGDIKPYGAAYKVVPLTNETATNAMTCLGAEGTEEQPAMDIQGVLPDTENFTKVGRSSYSGVPCEVYAMEEMIGNKKNTYTLLVREMPNSVVVPLYFEFVGYDNLFGSHYDQYSIIYEVFKVPVALPIEIFQIPSDLQCRMYPGPGLTEMNPVAGLLKGSGEINEEFEKFKESHGKSYPSQAEHEKRKANFRHNFRFIHSKNRQHLGFSLAVNHLADLSDSERNALCGRRSSQERNNGLPFKMTEEMVLNLVDSIDWRLYGAVTPVKDQGICGSCWSFGAAETIEGSLFLAKNRTVLTELSQQNLMDCTWGFGNNGCDGGEEWRSYEWMMKHGGIATAESYGPYLMADGDCHFARAEVGACIESYVNVTSGSQLALKAAIANYGPIAVGIDASHRSFAFYSNGVYYEPQCGNTMDDLDHSVLAVGYGSIYGLDYWLIKNSWSTHWGDDGYTLMSMKDNNCGVATDATYVNIKS